MPNTVLTVDIAAIPILFQPSINKIIVRAERGNILLFIDNKKVVLSTVVAHKTGLTIARAIPTLADHEMIIVTIDGEKIELLKLAASRLSTALLRKSDDADDWQILHRKRK